MHRRLRPITLALSCLMSALRVSHATAQNSTDAAGPDTAAVADTGRKTLGELPIYITGYVTTSYVYAWGHTENNITGRYYDRFHDTFIPNALRLGIEKLAATDKVDVGVRFELLFGTDAQVTQAFTNSGTFNLGTYGDLTEAYVTVNVPLSKTPDHWVQFKAGKMWTLMGYEVIDDVLDPNLSVGNQFTYLENFTNVGVGADFKFGPKWDAQLRLINGWDWVEDNNPRKSLMARVGFTPSAAFSLGVLGYFGPEQPGDENISQNRQGVNVVAIYKGIAKTNLVAQFDYGSEEGLGQDGGSATWWGIGGWVQHDLSAKTQLALRADYVDDADGVRTSLLSAGSPFGFPDATSRQFGSVTGTLNWRIRSKFLLRPELRYDYSSQFDYGPTDDPQKWNFSIGMGASYQF